jgi:Ca2+-binding EF-hand superfamily protein
LMSVKDFYNSVTPNSSITHGSGQGIYALLKEEDIRSDHLFDEEKVPVPGGLLNKIQKEGLLTYSDFIFLLHLLSTPRRYMDICFYAFDITANGRVDAQEFSHVMCNIINYSQIQKIIDPKDLMRESHSGLMSYLFGEDRSKSIRKEDFQELRRGLIDDLLWLEFTRYSQDNKTISTVDFCQHLLANNKIPKKKQQQMVRRVKRFIGAEDKGVTFKSFRAVCHLLLAGADLERAMYFMDRAKSGIDSLEFKELASFIANMEVDQDTIEILYVLLDDDYDGQISIKEFNPVLFKWRNSRGFQHASLQVSLGELKI